MNQLPLWGIKLVLRLAGLEAGAYSLLFIVEPDGTRRLILPAQVSRVENLGGNSRSDNKPTANGRMPQVELRVSRE